MKRRDYLSLTALLASASLSTGVIIGKNRKWIKRRELNEIILRQKNKHWIPSHLREAIKTGHIKLAVRGYDKKTFDIVLIPSRPGTFSNEERLQIG